MNTSSLTPHPQTAHICVLLIARMMMTAFQAALVAVIYTETSPIAAVIAAVFMLLSGYVASSRRSNELPPSGPAALLECGHKQLKE